jgi:hypothetical protein
MPALIAFVYAFIVGLIAFSQTTFAFRKQIKFRDQDFILIRGTTSHGDLHTRDAAIPRCSSFGLNYDFLQINGVSGEACIGWESFPNCGNGSWDDPDWADIQDAMGEIVTKGDQLSSSNVGAWNGTLLTTTFSEHDTSLFNFFLAEVDVKASTIYWSRNNDSAQVTRVPRCP